MIQNNRCSINTKSNSCIGKFRAPLHPVREFIMYQGPNNGVCGIKSFGM